jgi:hypothetical protein
LRSLLRALFGPTRIEGPRGGVESRVEAQFVPEVAKEADQLDVFQRTPNWILAKSDLEWLDVRRDVMYEFNSELQKERDGVEVWRVSCNNDYRTESGRELTQEGQ